jgi:hypothetical protein
MPTRLLQLPVDLIHNRVLIPAYGAYVHYPPIAQIDAASNGLPDPIDMAHPSIDEIGEGSSYAQHII